MAKTSKNTTANVAAEPESFEAASEELEKIVADMEAGQMPLEASLLAYQRGAYLLQYCQKNFKVHNNKLKYLKPIC